MTVPIRESGIKTENVVKGFSRYAKQRVVYWSDQNLLTFNIYVRQPYTVTGQEKVMVIKAGVQYRPDLVSYDIYGFPDGWWRILEANGMKDVWEFKSGKTIIIPGTVI